MYAWVALKIPVLVALLYSGFYRVHRAASLEATKVFDHQFDEMDVYYSQDAGLWGPVTVLIPRNCSLFDEMKGATRAASRDHVDSARSDVDIVQRCGHRIQVPKLTRWQEWGEAMWSASGVYKDVEGLRTSRFRLFRCLLCLFVLGSVWEIGSRHGWKGWLLVKFLLWFFQVQVLTLFLAFWRQDHFVMSYWPGRAYALLVMGQVFLAFGAVAIVQNWCRCLNPLMNKCMNYMFAPCFFIGHGRSGSPATPRKSQLSDLNWGAGLTGFMLVSTLLFSAPWVTIPMFVMDPVYKLNFMFVSFFSIGPTTHAKDVGPILGEFLIEVSTLATNVLWINLADLAGASECAVICWVLSTADARLIGGRFGSRWLDVNCLESGAYSGATTQTVSSSFVCVLLEVGG